jgi:hypothetical protein
MTQRITTDIDGNSYPSGVTVTIDHVESRMVISVVGMNEITENDIRELIQTKYKVAAIHTDRVVTRGKRYGRHGFADFG